MADLTELERRANEEARHGHRKAVETLEQELSELREAADELANAASNAIAWVEQALEGDEDSNPDYEIVTAGNAALRAFRTVGETDDRD